MLFRSLKGQTSPFPQVTVTLYPIDKIGGKYYFNGAGGSFESVKFPMRALNDVTVNSYLDRLQFVHKAGQYIITIPMLYVTLQLLTTKNTQNINYVKTREIMLGSIVAGQIFQLVETIYRRKAIKTYNNIVLKPQVGFNGRSLEFGFNARF